MTINGDIICYETIDPTQIGQLPRPRKSDMEAGSKLCPEQFQMKLWINGITRKRDIFIQN